MIPNVKSNVKRFDEIVRVLAKYGLAEWIGDGTPGFIRRRFTNADGTDVAELPFAVRVRAALTELGTTFIKLGQMMSTRADLVGPELAAELAALQADTPADPPEVVRELVASELGMPVEELFAWFNDRALASASVGQVHLARLMDGTEVVVKVQHAGIEETVQSDLKLLMSLAQLAENNSKELAYYRPSATVTEFRRSLLRELDFGTELSNLQQFAHNFAGNPEVHIPAAYHEYSSRRVLTMEKLDGYSIANVGRLAADDVDTAALAVRFAHAMLDMIFKDGFYHADPHPGNLFVLPGERLGLLDCGKVGRVDEQTQDDFLNIVQAFVGRDVERLTDELIRLCDVPPNLDRAAYRADVADFVAEFSGNPDEHLNLGAAFDRMFALIRRHHLIVPARVNMLLLVIVQLEGTAGQLDPDFNLVGLLQGYGTDLVWRRFSPERLQREVLRSSRDWNRLFRSSPREVVNLLEQAQRGELQLHIQHHGIERPLSRLVYGMLIAALFLRSALLWSTGAPPTLFGVSILGVLGLFSALGLGLHLLSLLWRTDRI
ncbi:MAG: AarF/ABC1/UbiB kinase family protein [Caldilineaceae bacterium]|nr:AarF/ABC1/UbiB kinase family protein [Caldilineaceae bacterium]